MDEVKIDFRCPRCERLLRVSAVHRGKWVACPECDEESQVPDESESPVELDVDTIVWNPTKVSVREIFRDTWDLYVQNLWMLLGVAIVDLLFYFMGFAIVMVPTLLAVWMLVLTRKVPPEMAVLAGMLLAVLGLLTLMNYMACRHAKFYLKVARGEQFSFKEALRVEFRPDTQTLLPLVFGTIVGIGLLILVIPGAYVYLMMWPYLWVWADRQTPDRAVDSFPLAKELTKRNISGSIAISLVVLVGACFAQAEIFTGTFVRLLKAVAYLKMSGQDVGIRRERD